MYHYSKHSMKQRATLHTVAQLGLDFTLIRHDFKIIQGGRTDEQQWAYYNKGTSTLHPPQGKHLIQPDGFAYAADVHPYVNGKPVDTSATGFRVQQAGQFGYFLAILEQECKDACDDWYGRNGDQFDVRLGANWDMDAELLTDQSFDDWFHIEWIRR